MAGIQAHQTRTCQPISTGYSQALRKVNLGRRRKNWRLHPQASQAYELKNANCSACTGYARSVAPTAWVTVESACWFCSFFNAVKDTVDLPRSRHASGVRQDRWRQITETTCCCINEFPVASTATVKGFRKPNIVPQTLCIYAVTKNAML